MAKPKVKPARRRERNVVQPAAAAPAQTPRIEYRSLDALKPYEKNPRTHSPEQVQRIADSIKEFGFNNPILIDRQDGIIAGHGRLQAARLLQYDKVPVVELSHLTPDQKRAYVIADNKLALDAGWDTVLLAAEIADLKAAGFNVALTGFSDAELGVLVNGWSPDWEKLAGTQETAEGARALIRITCESGDKPELLNFLKAALETSPFEHVTID